MFTAVALPSFIYRFPITQNSQLQIYNVMQQQIILMRNITKHSHISVVKALMTNNTQLRPSALRDLRGTHKSREFSVMYVIDFNVLSHLQLLRPLYELFLEIIKAHGSL